MKYEHNHVRDEDTTVMMMMYSIQTWNMNITTLEMNTCDDDDDVQHSDMKYEHNHVRAEDTTVMMMMYSIQTWNMNITT